MKAKHTVTKRTNAERRRVLRELMAKHRLSGVGLGEQLNVHPVTISKWRNGTYPVPEATLRYLELYTATL